MKTFREHDIAMIGNFAVKVAKTPNIRVYRMFQNYNRVIRMTGGEPVKISKGNCRTNLLKDFA